MGLQQSRSAGGNDETRVRPKSSNLSERLSASFPRLQKTRGSNSVASTTEGKARKTGDAARGENGSETPELSAPDSSKEPNTEMPQSVTVPCQYRTGRTLGSGTYAIVKEAIHIGTGKYYACKVINKKLMEGREHMVRNEIAVLKRISSGNVNIVTLHDYFETAHNLYLVFDLCTGGELFDRICAKGNYYEEDAAHLVRTIIKAVKYIHDSGIVHRDLKPENLLFRTPAEDADIMIADFGLSRVMEEEKLHLLKEVCGTPGYMAPEIFKKTGHGKPVDIWAMGVITYFLLAGYTPFDRDSQHAEMEAIIAGDYKFEPAEYWENVSEVAKDFVRECLTNDPLKRPTAAQLLEHRWLADEKPHFVADSKGAPTDLLPHVKRAFNAKRLWKKAGNSIKAMNRMAALANSHNQHPNEHVRLRENINKYKEESEKEIIENATVTHHHNMHDVNDLHRAMAKTAITAA
ncbi:hypothetical protein AX14_006658 [Amanita brunnescens Koide BX004]|nr:hypothetical protein AX14_006658 [Amanita brunnescens Koide BX004]